MLTKWYEKRALLLDVFIIINLAFLVLDVYIAHSIEEFHSWETWVPVIFSAIGALILTVMLILQKLDLNHGAGRLASFLVGWASIIVGVWGMFLHLESQFFQVMSLKSLVYTAPFAAPLAFAGIGFLLLLNRMVGEDEYAWGWWIVFLAWGGFIGNFVLSLADHAQNGFFVAAEWIPVFSSALAVGFMLVSLWGKNQISFLRQCQYMMVLQAAVGGLGFILHLVADLTGPSTLFDNFLYGAPIFAPLLFVNLAMLGALGYWDMIVKTAHEAAQPQSV